MSKWDLTDEIIKKIEPIISAWMTKMENMTDEEVSQTPNEAFCLELTDTGINPYQLRKLLETKYGYEHVDSDQNGWEMDFWLYMKRKDDKSFPSECQRLVICGCGMTFTLTLDIQSML